MNVDFGRKRRMEQFYGVKEVKEILIDTANALNALLAVKD